MTPRPSLDVIIERLKQNTDLTKEIRDQVVKGFKDTNGRIGSTERRLDKLEWQRKNDEEELERKQEEAKQVIADAAAKAKNDMGTPKIGSTAWMMATLVAIILALIGARIWAS